MLDIWVSILTTLSHRPGCAGHYYNDVTRRGIVTEMEAPDLKLPLSLRASLREVAPRTRLLAIGSPTRWTRGFGLTGLEPATSSRATIRRCLFPGVALCWEIGLYKPISLLAVAHHCSALRLEWCQQ